MEKSESCLQRQIIRHLEGEGWFVLKLIQTNKNGIPDLLAIRQGVTIFVEVKRAGAKARPLQEYRMKEIHLHGINSFVAHSVEEVKKEISKQITEVALNININNLKQHKHNERSKVF